MDQRISFYNFCSKRYVQVNIFEQIQQSVYVILIFCRFRCTICSKNVKCDHSGRGDVLKHCSTQFHLAQASAMKSQTKLSSSSPSSSENLKRIEAELRMAVLTASFNIPLAFHDHLSPMIRSIFPDSGIATNYHSAPTKATCMLNYAIAPILKKDLVDIMKLNPFSIAVDGSNDTR